MSVKLDRVFHGHFEPPNDRYAPTVYLRQLFRLVDVFLHFA